MFYNQIIFIGRVAKKTRFSFYLSNDSCTLKLKIKNILSTDGLGRDNKKFRSSMRVGDIIAFKGSFGKRNTIIISTFTFIGRKEEK